MKQTVECAYCGEEAEYVPLIHKPEVFFYNGIVYSLVNISGKNELICIECLDYELNEIRHN